MIHPDCVVRPVNPVIGNGVFATRPLPRGTIIVVRDHYDIAMTQEEFDALPALMRATMETHCYRDKRGHLILAWDHARLMNHNCSCNTMLTDYDLEIAVRDIADGEEITSEYGLLNIQEPYRIDCGCVNCRQHLALDDIDRYADRWDAQIKASLLLIDQCPQPLWDLVSDQTRASLNALRQHPSQYRSVRHLKWPDSAG